MSPANTGNGALEAADTRQIKPAPSLGTGAETGHIIGFGTLDERMRILMDVEKLMAGADMGLVDKAIH